MAEPTKKALAWAIFDRIVATAATTDHYLSGPWTGDEYTPDFETLQQLLGVPLHLKANSQSGVPALALDVWVAYELRRSGFKPDAVWPRAEHPRVMPGPISRLIPQLGKGPRAELEKKLTQKTPPAGVVATSANILGGLYVKQVDVVMSAWDTGPELLISTKRMDSSFGKNAANRIEESFGDARNLRTRHPMAALGFLYGLRSTILDSEPEKAKWLIDLLAKLSTGDNAYDAACLLMLSYDVEPPADSDGGHGDEEDAAVAEVQDDATDNDADDAAPEDVVSERLEAEIANLPTVRVLHDEVPPELQVGQFLKAMVEGVLRATPVNMHTSARKLRGWSAAD